MEDQSKSVLNEMEETRSSLTEKLEALETKVSDRVAPVADAVQRATEATAELVEGVKDKVQEVTEKVEQSFEKMAGKVERTVDSVSSALDFRKQFDRHPWFMFALATTTGCVLGNLTARRSDRAPEPSPAPQPARAKHGKSHSNGWERKKEESGHGGIFTEELRRLKALAIGALMGTVREVVKRSLPEALGDRLADEVDSLTTQLGAEPIRGPILSEAKEGRQSTPPNETDEKDSTQSVGDVGGKVPEFNRLRSRGAGSDFN